MAFAVPPRHLDGSTGTTERAPIEIGLLVAGRIDAVDRGALELARDRFVDQIEQRFPGIDWKVTLIQRPEISVAPREEPILLLDHARLGRDAHRWDYVLIITRADLIGHAKPFALAAVSRTMDAAVISTSRIDPHAVDADAGVESRKLRIAHRLVMLMLRRHGHLNGLGAVEDRGNLMWAVDDVRELDGSAELTEEQAERLMCNLQAVSDLRLEEQPAGTTSPLAFFLRAVWTQRHEIATGVLEAKPWQFPLRLSRLSTAAASAMLVLMMTAETWDMAMSQSAGTTAGLALAVLVLMTTYVVVR